MSIENDLEPNGGLNRCPMKNSYRFFLRAIIGRLVVYTYIYYRYKTDEQQTQQALVIRQYGGVSLGTADMDGAGRCPVSRRKNAGWSDSGSRNNVNLVVLVSGFIPVTLVLLAFLSKRGSDSFLKGLKVRFQPRRPQPTGIEAVSLVYRPISGLLDQSSRIPRHGHHQDTPIGIPSRDCCYRFAGRRCLVGLTVARGEYNAARAGLPKAFVFVGKQEE